MNKRNLNDEFFSLWILLAQTKDAIAKARQREFDRFNITTERRSVLWCIAINGGGASPAEIARQLFRELNSVSEIIKRMAKEGLVRKYKSVNKQGVTVELTEKGQELLEQSLYNDMDKRILSALTKTQRQRLVTYLLEIRRSALRELGIPEWSIQFPMGTSDSGEKSPESE